MADAPSTRTDALVARLKNNPIVALLIVVGLVVVAMASFSDSVSRIVSVARSHWATVSTDPAGITAPIHRDSLQQKYFSRFSDDLVRLDLAKLWYNAQWKDHFSEERSRRILIAFGRNVLSSVDKNAILFVAGDEDFFPLIYAQERENFRQDVVVVHFQLLRLPGYRNYTVTRLGLTSRADNDPDYDVVVQQILKESRRPQFFAVTVGEDPVTDSLRQLSLEGLVWRYDPTVTGGPHMSTRATADLLDRYDLTDILDSNGKLQGPFEPPVRSVVLAAYAFSFASLADATIDSNASGSRRYRDIAKLLNPAIK